MSVAEMKFPKPETQSVFRHILMASDFSASARGALSLAVELAKANASKLSVVHVCYPDWRGEMVGTPTETELEKTDVQQRLDAIIDSMHAQRPIARLIRQSTSVVGELLAVIAECGADLLVIGTHGRGGLSKLALGSVAEELLRTASPPVLTVGPRAVVGDVGKPMFQTILFATDFGVGSTKALPLLELLVRAHHSKLIVVHMIPPVPTSSTVVSGYSPAVPAAAEIREWESLVINHSRQNLRQWIAAQVKLDCEPEYVVGSDFLGEGICAAAAKYSADLIVMGTNRCPSPRLSAHLPWTAAHQVIHDAECPVLTIAG